MEYRRLGKSGLLVSEIGLGGNNFGGRIGEQESVSVIHKALDLGINFIDTADIYSQGHSEECVGKAVKGKRSEVIIATKFAGPMGSLPNERGTSRYHIMQAVEASLKRLDMEYIDLYYVHMPDQATPIEETLRTLNDLVRAGKVRYIGCSNFAAWQLSEALWTSRVNNLESFIVVQSQYNLLNRNIESELVPCCQNYGIGVIPWGPLSSGFLTGKYQRGKPAPEGARLATQQPPPSRPPAGQTGGRPMMFPPVLTDSNYDKLEKFQTFSAERGHKMGELAIAWLLSHPWLSSVIAGATSPEQVSANVAAANWKLTAQEVAELDKLV
jgi:aryl-alcohol dehydrogenase-like predicted oxidoreductase